jgi:hypothetical protein
VIQHEIIFFLVCHRELKKAFNENAKSVKTDKQQTKPSQVLEEKKVKSELWTQEHSEMRRK